MVELYKPVICRFCGEIDEGDPCWKCIREYREFKEREEMEYSFEDECTCPEGLHDEKRVDCACKVHHK